MFPLFLAGTLLTMLQVPSQNLILGVLMPWRISVLLVPISTALISTHIFLYIYNIFSKGLLEHERIVRNLSYFFIFLLVFGGFLATKVKMDRMKNDKSVPMMDYIKINKKAGEVYLIPVEIHKFKLERFRLYTEAPIFVDFKSHPYKDTEILEWYERVQIADKFYRTFDCKILKNLINKYSVTSVIIENEAGKKIVCENLISLYSDNHYYVYRLNK